MSEERRATDTRCHEAMLDWSRLAEPVCRPPRPVPAKVTTGGRSKLLAAGELAGFLALLNAYDRSAYANEYQDGKKVYAVTFNTAWDHLREERWVHDRDPFNVNQFGHPYQGATMHGFARSSGYVASTRDAKYGKFPDRRFTEGTMTIAYSFLGANQFGPVKW